MAESATECKDLLVLNYFTAEDTLNLQKLAADLRNRHLSPVLCQSLLKLAKVPQLDAELVEKLVDSGAPANFSLIAYLMSEAGDDPLSLVYPDVSPMMIQALQTAVVPENLFLLSYLCEECEICGSLPAVLYLLKPAAGLEIISRDSVLELVPDEVLRELEDLGIEL